MEFAVLEQGNDSLLLAGDLHADDPVLRGHFPGQGLLPGVVQVDWAVTCQPWYDQTQFVGIQRLKFSRLAPAGVRLTLLLADSGGGRVNFTLRCAEHAISSGQLCFRGGRPA